MENPSDLRHFCYELVRKYGNPGDISEEQKANEFRYYYLRDLPPSVKALQLTANICGCKLHTSDKMPKNMRGYNHVVNGERNIVIKDGDTLSGIQNTILHEIREIMEGIFSSVYLDYKPLRTSAKHYVANKFATAVLLPEESFTVMVYETGFDIIALAGEYAKSCSQVLLRIGEVLQGKLFFYAGMYEPGLDSKWRVTYWTRSHNRNDREANVYGLDGFFPRKGRVVVPGSLVDMTIREGRAHLVKQITLLQETDDAGLVAMASPLMIQEQPAKVILVVMLSQDRALLLPQIKRNKPIIINRFHQHL